LTECAMLPWAEQAIVVFGKTYDSECFKPVSLL
jgi:hypothetical protein